jgi:hypothetical protein
MAGALTDEAWAEICAAAKRHDPPLTPDADTRAEISAVLFYEYANMRIPRERMAKIVAKGAAPSMLRAIDKFAAKYRQLWQPHRSVEEFRANVEGFASPLADPRTQAHIFGMKILRRFVLANLEASKFIRAAYPKNMRSEREWLYFRLCKIWLDHFHAPYLTYTVPSLGGPPCGPLIEFLQAAMRQVMPEPSPETLRDAIDRVGADIEHNKQEVLFEWERRERQCD